MIFGEMPDHVILGEMPESPCTVSDIDPNYVREQTPVLLMGDL